jgi:hypothetical protein
MQVRIFAPIYHVQATNDLTSRGLGRLSKAWDELQVTHACRPIWRKLGPGAIQETEDRIGSAECSP